MKTWLITLLVLFSFTLSALAPMVVHAHDMTGEAQHHDISHDHGHDHSPPVPDEGPDHKNCADGVGKVHAHDGPLHEILHGNMQRTVNRAEPGRALLPMDENMASAHVEPLLEPPMAL